MRRFKKSQMEIMGLALVVILISLGLLFAVKFTALKPATSGARQAYTKTVKAANMLNTLLKTTSLDCPGGATITQLIQDCATAGGSQIHCDDIIGTPGAEDSCAHVKRIIGDDDEVSPKGIFGATFVEWGQDFYFTVKKGDISVVGIPPVGTECTGAKEHKDQPIPIPGELVTVTLELCG